MSRYTTGWGVFTVGTTTPVITPVTCGNLDFPTNVEVTGEDAGTLFENQLSVTKNAPVATLTTKAIEQALKLVALNGSCIGPTEGTYPIQKLDTIYRHEGDCDNPVGATSNYQVAIAKGLARLGTLTADRNADATITILAHGLTDGTNAPVAITPGVATPTGQIAERFRFGVFSLAGIKFNDLDGVSLEFTAEVQDDDPDPGSIYPRVMGVARVRPVWVFRGRDIAKVQNALIKLDGNAATHTDTTIQLVKLQNQASYYGAGENQHIAITTAGIIVPANLGAAAANARATNELRLPAYFDGSNAPVKWTLNTTYNPDIGT